MQSTLGEVLAVLRNGVNCKQDKSGNGDMISRIESISDATFDLEKVGYAELTDKDRKKFRLEFGDILFSHINSAVHVGKTAVFDTQLPVYHGINLLLMRPTKAVTPRYLQYALRQLFESGYWRGVCKQSVNQASVNQQDISRVEIQYPLSIAEQQRIVGILDEAFDGIATAKANAEKNLQNARALFESHLQAVFTERGDGWIEQPLSALCDIKHGYAFDGPDFSSTVPEGCPIVVTPGNFTEDGKLLFTEKNTKRLSGESPPAFRFKLGDLVVVMTDLSSKMKILGKPAFVEGENLLHNQRIGRLLFSDLSVDRRLVYYFMMSEQFLKNIRVSATGTMVKHTAPTRILSNVISLPSDRPSQSAIVRKLDTLREETQRLESLYQQKLTALDALKKSLLHQAFSGAL